MLAQRDPQEQQGEQAPAHAALAWLGHAGSVPVAAAGRVGDARGEEGAVDLLSSGRPRPPEPRTPPPWMSRVRRLWRHRGTRAGAVVLVAAAALALLQVTVHPERRLADRAASQTPTASPFPTPPFDHRPGRTPIPRPRRRPATCCRPTAGHRRPGPASATRAANLVLGRYCADPTRYGLTMEPITNGPSHRLPPASAWWSSIACSPTRGTEMLLSLAWEGHAYRWFGPLALSRGC